MDLSNFEENAKTLEAELDWLRLLIDERLKNFWNPQPQNAGLKMIPPPDLTSSNSHYARICDHYRFGVEERLLIILALAPHICPSALDVFFTKNSVLDRGFTEFGGIRGQQHGGFLPTGETAAFLLCNEHMKNRLLLSKYFDEAHPLRLFNILTLESAPLNEPVLSGVLTISKEYLNYFTLGADYKPQYGPGFPAKILSTSAEWTDLVLEEDTLGEVLEIIDWIKHGDTLLNDWGLKKQIKPGFKSLFYGPPGTGKTFTAALLGKVTQLDVYRIDLSLIVSKFIGETEKNLANVFEQATNRNWILFFDEADALFGKRTHTSSAHDKYANQEVAYLLQRIEDFPGVVILATNLKANIDEAFSRRFQSIIHFPLPNASHRFLLWKNAFSLKSQLESEVDLQELASKYELSGGTIMNIVRYSSLMALKRNDSIIKKSDLLNGIRKEFAKDGRIIN